MGLCKKDEILNIFTGKHLNCFEFEEVNIPVEWRIDQSCLLAYMVICLLHVPSDLENVRDTLHPANSWERGLYFGAVFPPYFCLSLAEVAEAKSMPKFASLSWLNHDKVSEIKYV